MFQNGNFEVGIPELMRNADTRKKPPGIVKRSGKKKKKESWHSWHKY